MIRQIAFAAARKVVLYYEGLNYVIARLIVLLTVGIGSAWLVSRYKAIGGVVSVLLGWLILWSVYNAWPAPPTEYDEDREDMYIMAPILMTAWSAVVFIVTGVREWVNKRGKWGNCRINQLK